MGIVRAALSAFTSVTSQSIQPLGMHAALTDVLPACDLPQDEELVRHPQLRQHAPYDLATFMACATMCCTNLHPLQVSCRPVVPAEWCNCSLQCLTADALMVAS